MAKHGIRANRTPAKPKSGIRAAKSFYEKTHPVGSAERFLDEAAKEALAAAAAGGVITPRAAVVGAAKAVADEMEKYPDPLLAEAAKLSRDELAKRAARAVIHQRAMEAQNAAVRVASAVSSPVGNMVANNTALTADEVLGTRQDTGGGYAGGRNTVSHVEARNTTKRERKRVAAIEAALREDRRPKLEARVEPSEPRMTREQARELMSGRGGQGDPDAMLGERMNPLTTAAMMSLGLPESAVQTLAVAGMTTATMAGLEGLREDRPKTAGLLNLALTAAGLAEGPAESGDPQPAGTNQDSKGGNTRTDAKGGGTPGSPLGAPVPVGPAPAPAGPRIVINPQVFNDKRDALCVAFNEAFRIVMEDNAFDPVSEPTEKQRRFFADTAYADDEVQLRRTILARIATLDTSVSDPTDEQLQETAEMLEMVMEVGAPQNDWEQTCVKRLLDVVSASLNGTKNPGNPVDREPPGIV